MTSAKSIFIIAGEASGDMHAAKLIRELQQQQHDIHISGFGGQAMQQAGAEIYVDLTQYSVTGFWEMIPLYRTFRRLFYYGLDLIKKNPPDLLILVDYPGFNLRFAKKAKQLGIKILYYISPQVWAWKAGRIKAIKETVDYMAVVFPFECDLYQQHQVPVSYVGHPLLDTVKPELSKTQIRQQLNVADDDKLITLLPGSRLNEVKQLLPVMLQAAEILKSRQPHTQFVIARAVTIPQTYIEAIVEQYDIKVSIKTENIYDIIHASHAALVASGTATLETALLTTPMIILYKTAALTYHLAKYFIKIKYIGMCNIIAGEAIVPELIQHQANGPAIAAELERMCNEDIYHRQMKHKLSEFKQQLQAEQQQQALTDIVNTLLEINDEQKAIN